MKGNDGRDINNSFWPDGSTLGMGKRPEPLQTYTAAILLSTHKSCLSALGPIADVRVFQVKQVQHVNASGQFVLFPIAAILTSVVVLGRFELPWIDRALAKFKND